MPGDKHRSELEFHEGKMVNGCSELSTPFTTHTILHMLLPNFILLVKGEFY